MSLWPRRRVLVVIEDAIYRVPRAGEEESGRFGLAAFDELLLLHAIAKVVTQPQLLDELDNDDGPAGDRFQATTIPPLSEDVSGPTEEDMAALATLLAGSRVDIDLDEVEKKAASSAPNLPHLPNLPDLPSDAAMRDLHGLPPIDKKGNLIEFDDFDAATSRLSKL